MTGTIGADYLYDADGQLAGASVNGSTVANRLVPGPWPDEIALAYQGSDLSLPYWSTQDRLGSVMTITDGSGGVIALNSYDEYGQPRGTNGGRLMYTGQMWLPDWGMYHYKGRQYRPDLGRFLQTDPIGYAGGMNLYGYVAGDPVNRTDPFGLDWIVRTCTRTEQFGVDDAEAPGGVSWSTRTVSYDCSIYVPGQNDLLTGRPDDYVSGVVAYNQTVCGVGSTFVGLSFYASPAGWVALPTPKSGGLVVIGRLGADVSAGLGFSFEVGTYSYEATNGVFYRGFFASPGLSVGAGASISGGISWVGGLDNFFGDGWSANVSLGAVAGSISGGDSGLTGGGLGGALGAGGYGTASYTHPVGPAVPDCDPAVG